MHQHAYHLNFIYIVSLTNYSVRVKIKLNKSNCVFVCRFRSIQWCCWADFTVQRVLQSWRDWSMKHHGINSRKWREDNIAVQMKYRVKLTTYWEHCTFMKCYHILPCRRSTLYIIMFMCQHLISLVFHMYVKQMYIQYDSQFYSEIGNFLLERIWV